MERFADAAAFNRALAASTSASIAECLRDAQADFFKDAGAASRATPLFPLSHVPHQAARLARCLGMVLETDPAVALLRASRRCFAPDAGATCDLACSDDEFVSVQRFVVIPVPGNTYLYDSCGASLEPRFTAAEPSGAHRGTKRAASERSEDSAPAAEATMAGGGNAQRGTVWEALNLPRPPLRPALAAACVVTIVQQPSDAPVHLHDLVECFGFLELPEPPSDGDALDDDEDAFGRWRAESLPAGLVRRLRCIAHRPALFGAASLSGLPQHRAGVLAWLTERVARGDALAAELLLLSLCSRVHSRHASTPIGDVPLYLHHPSLAALGEAEAFSAALRPACPVGEVLLDPARRLAPAQDVAANAVRSGQLQLPAGAHATVVANAALRPSGSSGDDDDDDDDAEAALFGAVHRQVVELRMPPYGGTVELPCDVGFLVLSALPPSAQPIAPLRLACALAWRPAAPASVPAASPTADDEAAAAACRRFVFAARAAEPTVGADDDDGEGGTSAAGLQAVLARACRDHPRRFNGDPLVHNNTVATVVALARAHAASLGASAVATSHVEHALALDALRFGRQE